MYVRCAVAQQDPRRATSRDFLKRTNGFRICTVSLANGTHGIVRTKSGTDKNASEWEELFPYLHGT